MANAIVNANFEAGGSGRRSVSIKHTQNETGMIVALIGFLLETNRDTIRVWYGAKKQEDPSRHIGYAENSSTTFLQALIA